MHNAKPITAEEMEYIRHLYFDEHKGMQAIARLIHRRNAVACECVRKLGKPRGLYERFKGKDNPNWRGGKRKNGFGYIDIWIPPDSPYMSMCRRGNQNYIVEHRLVMAQHIGRCLDRFEIVHHLNGVRDDNRLSNLALVTRSNHSNRTLLKIYQKRIRELESELAQQKLSF